MRKIKLLLLPTASLTEDGTEPIGESAQGGSCLESPVFGGMETETLQVQVPLGLHSEFWARFMYTTRLWN